MLIRSGISSSSLRREYTRFGVAGSLWNHRDFFVGLLAAEVLVSIGSVEASLAEDCFFLRRWPLPFFSEVEKFSSPLGLINDKSTVPERRDAQPGSSVCTLVATTDSSASGRALLNSFVLVALAVALRCLTIRCRISTTSAASGQSVSLTIFRQNPEGLHPQATRSTAHTATTMRVMKIDTGKPGSLTRGTGANGGSRGAITPSTTSPTPVPSTASRGPAPSATRTATVVITLDRGSAQYTAPASSRSGAAVVWVPGSYKGVNTHSYRKPRIPSGISGAALTTVALAAPCRLTALPPQVSS
mmetsp:Transcript_68357/g.156983  ORF Transcript_68357/g.156983 Transcript_68357/m.156983 type:complete len:301 (-) Transcript_68357:295-1197(-)